MPPFGPISRTTLIRGLRTLGFTGPIAGGRHAFMIRNETRVTLPNPHQGDISIGLLARILRQAGVTRDAWEQV